jgi:type IV pilus assembly protein PilV
MRINTTSRRCTRPSRAVQSQRGIVLIDALVALLIFMLGVLGMLGLQGTLTTTQTEAKNRADASFLAMEVIGRMWSDLASINAYTGSGCGSQPKCSEWQSKVAMTLPAGTGAITVDPANGDIAVVVSWKMPSGDVHRYTTHTTIAKAGN